MRFSSSLFPPAVFSTPCSLWESLKGFQILFFLNSYSEKVLICAWQSSIILGCPTFLNGIISQCFPQMVQGRPCPGRLGPGTNTLGTREISQIPWNHRGIASSSDKVLLQGEWLKYVNSSGKPSPASSICLLKVSQQRILIMFPPGKKLGWSKNVAITSLLSLWL